MAKQNIALCTTAIAVIDSPCAVVPINEAISCRMVVSNKMTLFVNNVKYTTFRQPAIYRCTYTV